MIASWLNSEWLWRRSWRRFARRFARPFLARLPKNSGYLAMREAIAQHESISRLPTKEKN